VDTRDILVSPVHLDTVDSQAHLATVGIQDSRDGVAIQGILDQE